MRRLYERAYLSLGGLAFLVAQQDAEAPGGRGDDPGEGGGLALILGIAIGFLVALAIVFLLVRSRAGRRTNPPRAPKSPRGRTGV